MPQLTRVIAAVVAILLGGQPSGMQRNLTKITCKLCESGSRDEPHHVLFDCVSLDMRRILSWPKVVQCMPLGMIRDITECGSSRANTELLLSCLVGSYIPEWGTLYAANAKFIYDMYQERKTKYDSIEESAHPRWRNVGVAG